MTRKPRLLLAPLGVALLGGCAGTTLDWRNHASFRAEGSGNDIRLAQLMPGEHLKAGISRNLHYVALSFDTVFFRDLPGLVDRSVVMGVEIEGAVEGKKLKGVIDVRDAIGKHAFLSFDNAMLIEPFLFGGRPLTVTLHFRAVPKSAVPIVREATLARLGGRLNPLRGDTVERAAEKFTQVFEVLGSTARTWSYSLTLFPPDTTHLDKPEMLLTATRHILLAIPPVDADASLRARLNPYKLIGSLKMRGNRLVDARSGIDFVESPYVVLNVTRFKRYPKSDTPLARAVKKAETFLEEGNLEIVPALLREIGVEINGDQVLTTGEKNLERMRNEIREVAYRAAVARREGEAYDKARETGAAAGKSAVGGPWNRVAEIGLREIKLWSSLLKEHAAILEPFEIADVAARIRRLAARTEEVFARVARDVSEVKAVVAGLDRRLDELKKSDADADEKLRRLTEDQEKFKRDIEKRFAALAASNANRVRATYLPKWYEKAWVWSAITVGTLAVTGTVLYLTVFKKADGDNIPSATLQNP